MVKNQEAWIQPLGREDPWRRKWQSAPVFLPGKSPGERSLADYRPWGHKRVRHDSMQQFVDDMMIDVDNPRISIKIF